MEGGGKGEANGLFVDVVDAGIVFMKGSLPGEGAALGTYDEATIFCM